MLADGLTDGQKIGRLYCTLLQAGAIKMPSDVLNKYRIRSSCACAMYHPGPSCSKCRQLNELVKGHLVNCFNGFNTQYSDIFC